MFWPEQKEKVDKQKGKHHLHTLRLPQTARNTFTRRGRAKKRKSAKQIIARHNERADESAQWRVHIQHSNITFAHNTDTRQRAITYESWPRKYR
jgi:hypothetical protein